MSMGPPYLMMGLASGDRWGMIKRGAQRCQIGPDVPHRQVVFSIPRMLRIFFKYNRRVGKYMVRTPKTLSVSAGKQLDVLFQISFLEREDLSGMVSTYTAKYVKVKPGYKGPSSRRLLFSLVRGQEVLHDPDLVYPVIRALGRKSDALTVGMDA